jgi:exopolyphosphatase
MATHEVSKLLNEFLKNARVSLKSENKICIVSGNEAADLDSMASALIYAWYKTTSNSDSSISYVPLIPIPREDFKLRTEAVFLFGEAGVTEEEMLFADDIDLTVLKNSKKLSLALVDHNKPAKSMADLSELIVGIVDHHQDEGLFPSIPERCVKPVGSAITLVAEKLLALTPPPIDKAIAVLIAGTILLDTVNLDPQAGRVTPKDFQVVSALMPLTFCEQSQLFETLQYEKFNVSKLSTSDLLRKDYKEYAAGNIRYGMSSVLLSIDSWKKKDSNLCESLAHYARQRKLNILLAMNAYTDPEFKRELVVYCSDPAVFAKTSAFLNALDLGLAAVDAPDGSRKDMYGWYAQANGSYSRKKLQPPLQEFLAGL